MRKNLFLLSMGIILTISGCNSISQEEYEAKVAELESAKNELNSAQNELDILQSQISEVKNELAETQDELESTKTLYDQASKHIAELEKTETEDDNTDTPSVPNEDTTSIPTVFTLKYGKLLDSNPNGGTEGNTLVIKAKITPSLTNEMTITQNYHNIVDLVLEQRCDTFDSIDYWAVADMADGSEGKVISFLVNSECINGIKNKNIAALTLDQYLEDLWILPSLQQ